MTFVMVVTGVVRSLPINNNLYTLTAPKATSLLLRMYFLAKLRSDPWLAEICRLSFF
jgi:hypothetical protein